MTGMQSFGRKQKREQRRRNHIARDLNTPKYRQRVKESKKWKEKRDRTTQYDEEEDTDPAVY